MTDTPTQDAAEVVEKLRARAKVNRDTAAYTVGREPAEAGDWPYASGDEGAEPFMEDVRLDEDAIALITRLTQERDEARAENSLLDAAGLDATKAIIAFRKERDEAREKVKQLCDAAYSVFCESNGLYDNTWTTPEGVAIAEYPVPSFVSAIKAFEGVWEDAGGPAFIEEEMSRIIELRKSLSDLVGAAEAFETLRARSYDSDETTLAECSSGRVDWANSAQRDMQEYLRALTKMRDALSTARAAAVKVLGER